MRLRDARAGRVTLALNRAIAPPRSSATKSIPVSRPLQPVRRAQSGHSQTSEKRSLYSGSSRKYARMSRSNKRPLRASESASNRMCSSTCWKPVFSVFMGSLGQSAGLVRSGQVYAFRIYYASIVALPPVPPIMSNPNQCMKTLKIFSTCTGRSQSSKSHFCSLSLRANNKCTFIHNIYNKIKILYFNYF